MYIKLESSGEKNREMMMKSLEVIRDTLTMIIDGGEGFLRDLAQKLIDELSMDDCESGLRRVMSCEVCEGVEVYADLVYSYRIDYDPGDRLTAPATSTEDEEVEIDGVTLVIGEALEFDMEGEDVERLEMYVNEMI